eukprot:4712647-Pleurochrysis_carterae.AAC.1
MSSRLLSSNFTPPRMLAFAFTPFHTTRQGPEETHRLPASFSPLKPWPAWSDRAEHPAGFDSECRATIRRR